MSTRRGWGEDGIFFEHTGLCRDGDRHRHCPGRWRGVISLGYGPDGKRIRRKVSGKTRAVVQERLKALHSDLDSGVKASPNYTVRRAAQDWLAEGLDGRSAKTVKKNENVLAPILTAIGSRRLRELTADDVRQALTAMAARYSTAAVAMGHNALTRAIRHAEGRDLVSRNVATLVDTPKGQAGRPSKSLTLDQASALLAAAVGTRMHAYIALCLATGIRTEEARALRWEHVSFGDPDATPPIPASAAVWRSVRAHGDTKTEKSRRTLALPHLAIDALQAHQQRQDQDRHAAGERWDDQNLVFATRTGAPSTPPTSGASSGPPAKPPASGRAGHPANCATPSSPSCPAPESPSRKSPGSPATPAPAPPNSSTAANYDPSSPPEPKPWTPSSRQPRPSRQPRHRALPLMPNSGRGSHA